MWHAADRSGADGASAADLKHGLRTTQLLLRQAICLVWHLRIAPPWPTPEGCIAFGQQAIAVLCHCRPYLTDIAPPVLLAPPARKREGKVEPDHRLRVLLGQLNESLRRFLPVQTVVEVSEL